MQMETLLGLRLQEWSLAYSRCSSSRHGMKRRHPNAASSLSRPCTPHPSPATKWPKGRGLGTRRPHSRRWQAPLSLRACLVPSLIKTSTLPLPLGGTGRGRQTRAPRLTPAWLWRGFRRPSRRPRSQAARCRFNSTAQPEGCPAGSGPPQLPPPGRMLSAGGAAMGWAQAVGPPEKGTVGIRMQLQGMPA